MSDKITPELVSNLVAYGKKRQSGAILDSGLKEDVLDYAYDTYGFEGDDDQLWDTVAAGMSETLFRAEGGDQTPKHQKDTPPPSWKHAEDARLLTAPYRFTPVNAKVAKHPSDKPKTPLNRSISGNLSCVIDVDWIVETPILCGEGSDEGKAEPFLLNGEPAIPGATLRGCLRATTETHAFARMFQIGRHKRFALRDFEHPEYKKFIEDGQRTPGLQAGWLNKIDGQPHITPCAWGYVPITQIKNSTADSVLRDWIMSDRAAKYRDQGIDWIGNGAFQASQPFASMGTDDKNRSLFKADASNRKGTYVFSGKVPMGPRSELKKQFEYVFFDGSATRHAICEEAWATFQLTNCKPSQNKSEPDGAWAEFYESYEAGNRVPVFFVGNLPDNGTDRDFSFGLTRLYRIPHRYSVGEILARENHDHIPARVEDGELVLQPDFVEHLFGYVYEPDELKFGQSLLQEKPKYNDPKSTARKGRVAVGFARPKVASDFELWPKGQPVATIMGTPKPSFGPYYLAGVDKDYSHQNARLAGRKRYITRHTVGQTDASAEILSMLADQVPKDLKSRKVLSYMRFLRPTSEASAFTGRIKCRNVSPAELGALLWSITFGGNSKARHMIGRAKPFGAGQIYAGAITLHIRTNDAPADTLTIEWKCGDDEGDLKGFMDTYVDHIAALLGTTPQAWRNSPEVTALLKIATPGQRPWRAPGTTYLPFGKRGDNFKILRKKAGAKVHLNPETERPPDPLLKP